MSGQVWWLCGSAVLPASVGSVVQLAAPGLVAGGVRPVLDGGAVLRAWHPAFPFARSSSSCPAGAAGALALLGSAGCSLGLGALAGAWSAGVRRLVVVPVGFSSPPASPPGLAGSWQASDSLGSAAVACWLWVPAAR
jgi:hypothetical protein